MSPVGVDRGPELRAGHDQIDPLGNRTSYTYDTAGHLLTVQAPFTGGGGNENVTYVFDTSGHLTQTTDARGTVTGFIYDAAGNQTAETYPGAGSVSWAYDALNRRSSMTDVTGTTTWGYDAASRVTSGAAPGGGVSYTYHPAGSRATMIPTSPHRTSPKSCSSAYVASTCPNRFMDLPWAPRGGVNQKRPHRALRHQRAKCGSGLLH